MNPELASTSLPAQCSRKHPHEVAGYQKVCKGTTNTLADEAAAYRVNENFDPNRGAFPNFVPQTLRQAIIYLRAALMMVGERMPREASLFAETEGSVLEAYLLMKSSGANIPPAWIDRARVSRKNLESEVAQVLKEGKLGGTHMLRNWEERYRKECFYNGIRALFELERSGATDR